MEHPIITWFNNNLEYMNFGLSIIGFVLIWIQASRTRTAADAAKTSSEKAIHDIATFASLSDLNQIASSIKQLQDSLRINNIEVALFRCQNVRSELHKLRSRRQFASDDTRQEIQNMVTGLRKLQDDLERVLAGDTTIIDVPKSNQILSDYANRLYELAEEVTFPARSGT